MYRNLFFVFFMVAVCLADAAPLWSSRPYEIISGMKPHNPAFLEMADTDPGAWTVTGNGKLSLTSEVQLWRDKVAKLAFSKDKSVTIRPPKPLVVNTPGAGFEMWVYGPTKYTNVKYYIAVTDAKGKKYQVKLLGGGSCWAKKPWWGNALGLIPREAVFPLKVQSITFSNLSTKTGAWLAFDELSVFQLQKVKWPDTSDWKLPFPTTPDTILPSSGSSQAKMKLVTSGNNAVFTYSDAATELIYQYSPRTGTLSDLKVTVNKQYTFFPAFNGGIIWKLGERLYRPGDSAVKAQLLQKYRRGNRYITRWQLTGKHKILQYQLSFELKGKTLLVEVSSQTPGAIAFDCGVTRGTPTPRLVEASYLNNRWSAPQILLSNGNFVSVFLDWYKSNASYLVEKSALGCLKGAGIISPDSARIMGGSEYYKKNYGTRNPLYERMFITVSPDFNEVLPNIPNPASPNLAKTAELIYATRFYAATKPEHIDEEIKFWKTLKAYGASDLYVRFHSEQFRTPLRHTRQSRSLIAGRFLGGDDAIKKLVAGLRPMIKYVGAYNNSKVVHGFNKDFSFDMLVKDKDYSFHVAWGGNNFLPKSSAMIHLQDKFVPAFRAKYGWNAEYLDEVTNTPPWGLVDYDSQTPGAAKFTTVLRNYGIIALKERELYDGAPIWSEGNAMYLWAGLLDLDYAQCNRPDEPPVVDFKLRTLNQLENSLGFDLTKMYGTSLDYLLASQIVYGNMGHLWKNGIMNGNAGKIKIYRNILKSYFMMRQLQQLYSAQPVAAIRYHIGDKMLDVSAMFKSGKPNTGQVHTCYRNGLQVWVNRNQKEDWDITFNGKTLTLPPNGYAAILPGKLLEYSALDQRGRHRVDYSDGELYTYVDGRGVFTCFPKLHASHAYLLLKRGQEIKLIPEEAVKPVETVLLPGVVAETVTGLDIDGKPLPNRVAFVNRPDGLHLTTAADIFSYRIQCKNSPVITAAKR